MGEEGWAEVFGWAEVVAARHLMDYHDCQDAAQEGTIAAWEALELDPDFKPDELMLIAEIATCDYITIEKEKL